MYEVLLESRAEKDLKSLDKLVEKRVIERLLLLQINPRPEIREFLQSRLGLSLHPNKIILQTFVRGIDFLGWIHFSDHRVLRTKTKLRMIKRINSHPTEGTIRSYWGLMSHGNSHKLCARIFGTPQF